MIQESSNQSSLYWRRRGAWSGGTVSAVACSPCFAQDKAALAATQVGIFRTENGGATWLRAPQGPSEPNVLTVVYGETDDGGDIAFAATDQARLYRSRDGGLSWQELTGWAGLGVATSLVLSPDFRNDLSLFAGTEKGVFRSADSGETWELSIFGLLDPEVMCLACSPNFAASQLLWTGTAMGGFYRSRNAGLAWRDTGAGLPDSAVQSLLVSPAYAADETLYAGTESAGIYRSTDGGASWHNHGSGLIDPGVNCMAIIPDGTGQSLLAGTGAGLCRSSDGGATWALTEGGEFLALSLAAASEIELFAGTLLDGICISTDGGRSWQPSNHGIVAHAPPLAVMAPSSAHARIFALDREGLLASSQNFGASWSLQMPEQEPVITLVQLATSFPPTLFVSTLGGLYQQPIVEEDSDPRWQAIPLPEGLAGSPIHLAVAGSGPSQYTLLIGDETGLIFTSTDAGARWQALSVPWVGRSLLSVILAADERTGQIRFSSITAKPTEQGNYQIEVWRSEDGGENWLNLAVLESEVLAVVLADAPQHETQSLFVATRNRLIRIFTPSGGGELAAEQTFLAADVSITGLFLSPDIRLDSTLHVATNRGLYISRDMGKSCEIVGSGLEEETVTALLQPNDGDELHVVTLGGELWVLGEIEV